MNIFLFLVGTHCHTNWQHKATATLTLHKGQKTSSMTFKGLIAQNVSQRNERVGPQAELQRTVTDRPPGLVSYHQTS